MSFFKDLFRRQDSPKIQHFSPLCMKWPETIMRGRVHCSIKPFFPVHSSFQEIFRAALRWVGQSGLPMIVRELHSRRSSIRQETSYCLFSPT